MAAQVLKIYILFNLKWSPPTITRMNLILIWCVNSVHEFRSCVTSSVSNNLKKRSFIINKQNVRKVSDFRWIDFFFHSSLLVLLQSSTLLSTAAKCSPYLSGDPAMRPTDSDVYPAIKTQPIKGNASAARHEGQSSGEREGGYKLLWCRLRSGLKAWIPPLVLGALEMQSCGSYWASSPRDGARNLDDSWSLLLHFLLFRQKYEAVDAAQP